MQRFYKKAAAFVLRAVAKHSPELAQAVVNCGALDALVISLEEFDPGVKEAAAWALGYIARHNERKFASKSPFCLIRISQLNRSFLNRLSVFMSFCSFVQLSRAGSGSSRCWSCSSTRVMYSGA